MKPKISYEAQKNTPRLTEFVAAEDDQDTKQKD